MLKQFHFFIELYPAEPVDDVGLIKRGGWTMVQAEQELEGRRILLESAYKQGMQVSRLELTGVVAPKEKAPQMRIYQFSMECRTPGGEWENTCDIQATCEEEARRTVLESIYLEGWTVLSIKLVKCV